MTVPEQENQVQKVESAPSTDKELNFRKMEAYYERQIERERQGRLEAEKKTAELSQKKTQTIDDDEDDSDEPYVDSKRLNKKLSIFERKLEEKFDKKVEEKAKALIQNDRQDMWMRQNNDYAEVMQHAGKFADLNPDLAETILKMPEGFERNKLVYATIKGMGIHKPVVAHSSIQDTINSNRTTPYYQPSHVGTAPYASTSDFSVSGQKNAYDKMQELKSRLRL